MYALHPIQLYREMLTGILQWQDEDMLQSDSLFMIRQLARGRRLFAPGLDTAAYETVMAPVYQQMNREILAKAGPRPRIIQDPMPGHGYLTYNPEPENEGDIHIETVSVKRYTEPYKAEDTDRTVRAWQIIIQQEFIRLLVSVKSWEKNITDEDVLFYEFENLLKMIHELLQMAAQKEENQIRQILLYELAAMRKEVTWRKQEYLKRVESEPFPEPDPAGVKVLKSVYWWQRNVETLLENWTAKYYHTAPVKETVNLLVRLAEECEYRQKEGLNPAGVSALFRRCQIILLLIIIKKVDTERLKDEIQKGNHAENMLNQVDSLLQYGGSTPDETGRIIDYANLLDKADSEHNIRRFPIIGDRISTLKQLLTHAFSAPPPTAESRESMQSSGSLPTAAERLRHNYFTFSEIVELQSSTPGNVRKLLKKLGIEIVKRGDMKYVSYNDYTNAKIQPTKKG